MALLQRPADVRLRVDAEVAEERVKLDSFDLVSIAVGLHDRIGVTVEAAEVTEIVTVGDLVGLLQAKLPAPSNRATAA